LIVDPEWPEGARATDPATQYDSYETWFERFEYVVAYWPTREGRHWLAILDDPAPISFYAVGPDGERSGRDPLSGKLVADDPDAMLMENGDAADTLGAMPAGDAARTLAISQPKAGTYRIQVTGTGAGDAAYDIVSVQPGGDEKTLLHVREPAVLGEARKYEVEYRGTESVAQQVTDFRPEARLDMPEKIETKTPAVFDAGKSFDVDGRVVRWSWEFGDGATADGERVWHSFATAGEHRIRLTVVDASGREDSAEQSVTVEPRDPSPPASRAKLAPVPGPDGWVDADQVTTTLETHDVGVAGVASLSYWADGAEPLAPTTVEGDHAELTVTAEGETTIHFAATDADGNVESEQTATVNIDRTAPQSMLRTPASGATVPALQFLAGSARDDQSGVRSVAMTLRRESDGLYWDGSRWGGSETWLNAIGGHLWYRAENLPEGDELPTGIYAVQTRATDRAGHVETPTTPARFTVGPASVPQYIVRQLPGTWGTSSSTERQYGINAQGDIVGFSQLMLGFNNAVLWSGGTTTALPAVPGYQPGMAYGIADNGDVAGWSFSSNGRPWAALWRNAQPIGLGALDLGYWNPGRVSAAAGVNTTEDVVGWSSEGTASDREFTAVEWPTGQADSIRRLPRLVATTPRPWRSTMVA
jgi:hypothetical protein